MKTNTQWIQELTSLMQERPELSVKFFVDSETVTEHAYTEQRITGVVICPWHMFEVGDGIIETDPDDICEGFIGYDGLTPEQAEEELKKVPEVILVYMGV